MPWIVPFRIVMLKYTWPKAVSMPFPVPGAEHTPDEQSFGPMIENPFRSMVTKSEAMRIAVLFLSVTMRFPDSL